MAVTTATAVVLAAAAIPVNAAVVAAILCTRRGRCGRGERAAAVSTTEKEDEKEDAKEDNEVEAAFGDAETAVGGPEAVEARVTRTDEAQAEALRTSVVLVIAVVNLVAALTWWPAAVSADMGVNAVLCLVTAATQSLGYYSFLLLVAAAACSQIRAISHVPPPSLKTLWAVVGSGLAVAFGLALWNARTLAVAATLPPSSCTASLPGDMDAAVFLAWLVGTGSLALYASLQGGVVAAINHAPLAAVLPWSLWWIAQLLPAALLEVASVFDDAPTAPALAEAGRVTAALTLLLAAPVFALLWRPWLRMVARAAQQSYQAIELHAPSPSLD